MLSFNENYIKYIVFDVHGINDIIALFEYHFPELRELINGKRPIDQIKTDLNWILDPKYSVNLNCEQLIVNFRKRLIEGKTLSKGSKGGDMKWKNELYRDLDIDAIIKCLQEHLDNK